MRWGGHIELPQGFVEWWILNEAVELKVEYGPSPMYDRCLEADHEEGFEEPHQHE